MSIIGNVSDEFDIAYVATMNKHLDSEIKFGRPHGATVLFWQKVKLNDVRGYVMEGNSRCVDISFDVSNGICFIFNVYFPCLSN